MSLRDTGLERFRKQQEMMNDPVLKAEYLAKIRAKVAAEMKEEERKFFSDVPVNATHYMTWEYGYKSFYKLSDSWWYVWSGNQWHKGHRHSYYGGYGEYDPKDIPWEIPEQYLKLE